MTQLIATKEDLQYHLQRAIEIEHMTVPPYLCALYSIVDGKNEEAVRILRSVVMEEMLHMTLAANILNAIGGHPSLNHREFVPRYPAPMPMSDDAFEVRLLKFSEEALTIFLDIEHRVPSSAPPESDHAQSIGQYYEAIKQALIDLTKELGDKKMFTGDRALQIPAEYYYGGGGGVVDVTGLEEAVKAIDIIVDQGEGMPHSIFDGDFESLGEPREVAHWFRFNQLKERCYYAPGDKLKKRPSGPSLRVSWTDVYDMCPDPTSSNYPKGSELRRQSDAFNADYQGLLDALHRAFNGHPDELTAAVGRMFELKYSAIALMKISVPGKKCHAGPSFEFVGA